MTYIAKQASEIINISAYDFYFNKPKLFEKTLPLSLPLLNNYNAPLSSINQPKTLKDIHTYAINSIKLSTSLKIISFIIESFFPFCFFTSPKREIERELKIKAGLLFITINQKKTQSTQAKRELLQQQQYYNELEITAVLDAYKKNIL